MSVQIKTAHMQFHDPKTGEVFSANGIAASTESVIDSLSQPVEEGQETATIHPSYLPLNDILQYVEDNMEAGAGCDCEDGGSGAPSAPVAPPDWSVNDENDPAYIKNRTHYDIPGYGGTIEFDITYDNTINDTPYGENYTDQVQNGYFSFEKNGTNGVGFLDMFVNQAIDYSNIAIDVDNAGSGISGGVAFHNVDLSNMQDLSKIRITSNGQTEEFPLCYVEIPQFGRTGYLGGNRIMFQSVGIDSTNATDGNFVVMIVGTDFQVVHMDSVTGDESLYGFYNPDTQKIDLKIEFVPNAKKLDSKYIDANGIVEQLSVVSDNAQSSSDGALVDFTIPLDKFIGDGVDMPTYQIAGTHGEYVCAFGIAQLDDDSPVIAVQFEQIKFESSLDEETTDRNGATLKRHFTAPSFPLTAGKIFVQFGDADPYEAQLYMTIYQGIQIAVAGNVYEGSFYGEMMQEMVPGLQSDENANFFIIVASQSIGGYDSPDEADCSVMIMSRSVGEYIITNDFANVRVRFGWGSIGSNDKHKTINTYYLPMDEIAAYVGGGSGGGHLPSTSELVQSVVDALNAQEVAY